MASIFRRTIMYLGLAPEGAYEDAPQNTPDMQPTHDQTGYQPPFEHEYEMEGVTNVNPFNAGPVLVDDASQPTTVMTTPATADAGIRPVPAASSTTSVTTASPHVIAPTTFDDAQHVADRFMSRQPIILNLQGLGPDLARRLLDFASGLCYGLGGDMSKVANQVYLLVPADVELSEKDRNQLHQPGFRQ